MSLKIKVLEKGPMILTGSKVLKAIMDNYTPPIDLFVREVIQNSADAVLNNKEFVRIKFNVDQFDNNSLCESIPEIKNNIKSVYPNEKYNFISISDSNTCGLLGKPVKDENGGPNNLYNLVYDFMNDKDDDLAGGSCGIGKSVYYRYGNGICFYYTRTYENGKYVSKLAGALIQDEKKPGCFLEEKSSGIAYFGDLVDGKSIPVYDENQIEEFLSIFGLQPYLNDITGTIVIIPYVNFENLLDEYNTNEEDVQKYWLSDISSCLNMAIQRWYFSRINNEKYNGKYLKIAVNNVKVELCDFFQKLQDLYNGDLPESLKLDIYGKGFPDDEALGKFYYKVFTSEELEVGIPPVNNPSPKYFVDSSIDTDKNGLLFYTRKPGMILNYSNLDFGTYDIEDNSYLIGVFVLNDDMNVGDENLGKYLRKTEKSNHISWNNDNIKEFPVLSKKRPYSKISAAIKNVLNEMFKKTKAISLDASTTILQKKLGEKLLPPLDFGNKPSIKPDTPPKPASPKKNRIAINFDGMKNDKLSYYVECYLKPKDRLKFMVEIKAGSKKYSFKDWEEMEFDFPCSLERIEIVEFYIESSKKSYPQVLYFDENFTKRRKKLLDDITVYKVRGIATANDIPYGFMLSNAMDKQLKVKINILIKPVDNKYSIGFNASIDKEVPND